MAFGKRSLTRLPRAVLEQLAENRTDLLANKTEALMTATVAAEVPKRTLCLRLCLGCGAITREPKMCLCPVA